MPIRHQSGRSDISSDRGHTSPGSYPSTMEAPPSNQDGLHRIQVIQRTQEVFGRTLRAPGIGRRWIEPGTLVDDSTAAWSWLAGQKPPPDAMPYDQATYDAFLAPETQGGLGYEYWRVAPWAGGGIVLQGPGTGGDYWATH